MTKTWLAGWGLALGGSALWVALSMERPAEERAEPVLWPARAAVDPAEEPEPFDRLPELIAEAPAPSAAPGSFSVAGTPFSPTFPSVARAGGRSAPPQAGAAYVDESLRDVPAAVPAQGGVVAHAGFGGASSAFLAVSAEAPRAAAVVQPARPAAKKRLKRLASIGVARTAPTLLPALGGLSAVSARSAALAGSSAGAKSLGAGAAGSSDASAAGRSSASAARSGEDARSSDTVTRGRGAVSAGAAGSLPRGSTPAGGALPSDAQLLAEYYRILAALPQRTCPASGDCPTETLAVIALRQLLEARIRMTDWLAEPARLPRNARFEAGDVFLADWKRTPMDRVYEYLPYAGSNEFFLWTDCRRTVIDPNVLLVTPGCQNPVYQDWFQLLSACNAGDARAWTELKKLDYMGYQAEMDKGPQSTSNTCTGGGTAFWRADWPEGQGEFKRRLREARERMEAGRTPVIAHGRTDLADNARHLYAEIARELDRRIGVLQKAVGVR
ncbi:MAG: hypothetical protein HY553_11495 [Elusimicrobia bacterium]|nr:hypothetical protein [Elusimicrobiota bacterium]